jgi:D-alanine-D-alanine ligase
MTDLQRVMVLAGGLSHERDVSLKSGRRVTDALKSVGLDAVLHDADPGLLPMLQDQSSTFDAVFVALHGAAGEDGSLRGVLDLMGVPYAGAGPNACRVAFDKPTAKSVVALAGVLVPPGIALPHSTFRELGANAVLEAVVAKLGLPLMVKPARGGSALGAQVVREASELPNAMVQAFSYGDVAVVEHFIAGTEVAVTVIDTGAGPWALPAVEICVHGGLFYDYEARYTAGSTEFFAPARLSPELAAEAAQVAVLAHRALGITDLSRSDLIIDVEGRVWFLEVNVSPGMTETSLLPLAAAAAGLDLGVLCLDVLASAVARRSR